MGTVLNLGTVGSCGEQDREFAGAADAGVAGQSSELQEDEAVANPLDPARGVLVGVILSAALWLAFARLVVLIW
jgi:hypothetical protein